MVRQLSSILAATVVVAMCAGCSDDPESAVDRAEAAVQVKEKAVTDAQATADDTVDKFCGDAQSYIVALDRYGDVLTSTAPTVGDVRDGGSDLTEPAADVASAAEDAVNAQDELATAQQELKDARADLKAVQTSSSASPSSSDSSSGSAEPKVKATLHPMPPDETVSRVKQAQTELDAAQAGIGDETPLAQASQQFNAAAVALEMSWLSLFAASGCLTDDQQRQAQAAVSDYTLTLQNALTEAGYYTGPVDGVYGPETVDAVEALQKAHGLPVTGTVDQATADALGQDLQALGGAAADEALASTAAVQQTLSLAGFWDGPIDGQWTPALTDALKSFQVELGVKPTGTVDAATLAALDKAIATAQEPEPSPTETSTETPTESPSPSPTESESPS